jgi:hypothetical protein
MTIKKPTFSQELLLKIIASLIGCFGTIISTVGVIYINHQNEIDTSFNNRLYSNEQKTTQVAEKLDNHIFYTITKKRKNE